VLKSFYVIGVLFVVISLGFGQEEEDAQTEPTMALAPPEPAEAIAQQPIEAAAPPTKAVPATNPRQAPPVMPSPASGATPVRLQYPNSDVVDVLRLYEQLTGKKMVMDNFVQGKVNIVINKAVPPEEAIKIIQMNLLMNGFSLVPAEGDIVKVIGTGKNPRTAGIPVLSDEGDIPAGEQVVSFLFKLRYADPTELQQVLSQYLSPPQPYTSFLALPKSGSLLVTESTAVIRKLVTIIDQVDIPPAEVVSEFIKLERADASKVVDLLKEIFERNPNASGTQPVGGVRGVRVQPPGPPQPLENDVAGLMALTEESVVVGKIKLTADVRTNRIHVVTRPINMPFIRKLVNEFDANVEFAKPVTRPLRYISASDVLPVLVQALTEPGEEGAGGTGAPGAGQGNQQQQQQQQQQRRNQPNTNNQYAGTGGTSGENSLNVSEELSTTPVDTTPQAVTIGNAKIIADQRANAIITLGSREVVTKIEKILDEMDVKAPQVALSTVIGELTLGDDEEFGVDYFGKVRNRFVGTSNNTRMALPLPTAAGSPPSVSGVIDPANLINFSQIIRNVGSGTNLYVAAGNSFASIVHLLETTGRFKVINRPVVFTSNNKKAIIASGSEVPVPINTLTNVVNTTVTGTAAVASNIEFKRIALQLEVVPLINSEKEVSLDILQKLDSISGSTNVNGNSIPTIDTRYVRTNVSATSGSTIILGGLITDTNRKDASGIPVLSRIPYVGALFRNTTSHKERKELIILMCPEVTMTKLDLYRLRQQKEQKTHFGPEINDLCPDCPPPAGEDKQLPPPDLPMDTASMNGK